MPNLFTTARVKLRAIFTEGLPSALATVGPLVVALAVALRDLVSPVWYVPGYYWARFRAVWKRATKVERAMWGASLLLSVLAVWDFVWMVASPWHYAPSWVFNTVIGLLAYPFWAYMIGQFVADAGDTRANLSASELRVTTMLTERYRADLDVSVKVPDTPSTDPTRCVVQVGAVPYVFEYYDGEWRFA